MMYGWDALAHPISQNELLVVLIFGQVAESSRARAWRELRTS